MEYKSPIGWDEYWMKQLEVVSTRSKDPATKMAAMVVNQDNELQSSGYNGFPPGVVDSKLRWDDRDTKLMFVQHAEANAIIRARKDLRGCKLYVSIWPCRDCAKHIVTAGITEVIINKYHNGKKDYYKNDTTVAIFKEAGVLLRYFKEE
jgi:dCMP deaminase